MTDELTDCVFTFLQNYIHHYHLPPTLREISTGCHMGTSTTLRHLDRLEMLGRISRIPGKARSIILIDSTTTLDSPEKD